MTDHASVSVSSEAAAFAGLVDGIRKYGTAPAPYFS